MSIRVSVRVSFVAGKDPNRLAPDKMVAAGAEPAAGASAPLSAHNDLLRTQDES